MTKAEYAKFHRAFCVKMISVTQQKNADYSGAGDDPFRNFRQVGNLFGDTGKIDMVKAGFLTRMSDKMSRIASYISKGSYEVADESFYDTLHDLANYCALLAGYHESQKTDMTHREVAP